MVVVHGAGDGRELRDISTSVSSNFTRYQLGDINWNVSISIQDGSIDDPGIGTDDTTTLTALATGDHTQTLLFDDNLI